MKTKRNTGGRDGVGQSDAGRDAYSKLSKVQKRDPDV